MDIDIKEEDNYDTTEAGCVKHHPKHALLHWTGCYIEIAKSTPTSVTSPTYYHGHKSVHTAASTDTRSSIAMHMTR